MADNIIDEVPRLVTRQRRQQLADEPPPIRLENWLIRPSIGGPGERACGNVYNHPRFRDGDSITTSPVQVKTEAFVITKTGTYYQLGRPA